MKILLPFAWIYGGVMALRNWLFDHGLFTQTTFNLPIIAIGNLSVGGTGKTPHTEYLLKMLTQEGRRCAMLSRGYGRKTKGFYKVKGHRPQEVGDEPWQVQQKFPQIDAYVCERRVEGINKILETQPQPDVILLDDAYQHRYVHPGFTILLTDYSRPYYKDYVLPAGRLREFRKGYQRADLIIVTKCPENLSAQKMAEVRSAIRPLPHQQIFFSTFTYGKIYPFIPGSSDQKRNTDLQQSKVLLVCGIAKPQNLIEYLRPQCKDLEIAQFSDHHNFTADELAKLTEEAGMYDKIITTEKDAARLSGYQLDPEITRRLWIQPIEVIFLNHESNKFNKIISDYVTENSRNSTVD